MLRRIYELRQFSSVLDRPWTNILIVGFLQVRTRVQEGGHTSEVKDHIRCERKLIRPRPLVIGPAVPGMIEPYLRPYLHRRPHPVAQHQRALAVSGQI